MSRPNIIVGFVLLIGTSLAACNRQSGDDVSANDPFAATSARPEDQFGKEFGKAYRADPNSPPRIVTENDVAPVSLTTEPIVID